MTLTAKSKTELDSIIRIDYFEFMKNELERQHKRVNDFPFEYASKQFLIDHYPENAPVDNNMLTRAMFNYWNTNRKGSELPKSVQEGVLAQSTKRNLVDPYGYNSYLYYMAEKYAYRLSQDAFIDFVRSSGIDALRAVEDDFDEYITCMKYLTNHKQDLDDTYVYNLIKSTDTLIDFYSYPVEEEIGV